MATGTGQSDAPTNMSSTAALYDAIAMREADRLRTHPVEHALTLDAITSHLKVQGAKIADIGGATGGYAFPLADLGATVHLRDIAPGLIAIATAEQDRRILEGRACLASVAVGSALDELFPEEKFDAVLLLGPLYHLVWQHERENALRQALQLLDSSGTGLVFAAFITRQAHLRDIAMRDPARIERESAFYADYLATGVYWKEGATPDENRSSYHVGSPNDVRALVGAVGGRLVELLGIESILGGGLDAKLVDANLSTRDAWMAVLKDLAREEINLGSSDHWLAVISRA